MDVLIIFRRELRRALRSVRGLVLVGLFAAIAIAGVLLYVRFEQFANETGEALPPAMLLLARQQAIVSWFGGDLAARLAGCPMPLLALHVLATVLTPALVVLTTYDIVATDLQGRAIRYFAPRVRRSSLVLGKALASWVMIAVLLAVIFLIIGVWMVASGHDTLAAVLKWSPLLWAAIALDAAVYVALVCLISVQFRRPALALFSGIALLIGLGIVKSWLQIDAPDSTLLALHPGRHPYLLLSANTGTVAHGVAAVALWSAAALGLASWTLARKDI
jgi:ABC-type transport system involved in multi-copper enzyme maturation permease subunit